IPRCESGEFIGLESGPCARKTLSDGPRLQRKPSGDLLVVETFEVIRPSGRPIGLRDVLENRLDLPTNPSDEALRRVIVLDGDDGAPKVNRVLGTTGLGPLHVRCRTLDDSGEIRLPVVGE